MNQSPLTKSTTRAMRCETFFANSYLSPNAIRFSGELAETGTDFHSYRQAYIDHLSAEMKAQDQSWAWAWLSRQTFTDDARDLIAGDIPEFKIDPNTIYGTEVLLSVDEHMGRLVCQVGAMPGTYSGDDSFARATVDLVELLPDSIKITDYKTGWAKPDPHEAAFIAALAFSHFPGDRLLFVWDMIRSGAQIKAEFVREDLQWIVPTMRRNRIRKQEIQERYAKGEKLEANPTVGLCGFCVAQCPARPAWEAGESVIPPPQTDDDARVIAERWLCARAFVEQAGDALEGYLAKGPVKVGADLVAFNKVTTTRKYPLKDALALLGVDDVPHISDLWEIPMNGVTIGGLSAYSKAKKRAGLEERLATIAKESLRSEVTIRRDEPETADLLEKSVAAARAAKGVAA